METFVIIHGGWSGGWYFKDTAKYMRTAGHEVYTPTLTGVGERIHLDNPEVDLDTHIRDIINVLEFEELNSVNLVGYSYGGVVATAVLHQAPGRINQLIYLDGLVPEAGQAVIDLLPGIASVITEAVNAGGNRWQIPHNPPQPRKTSQPLKTFTQPVRLAKAQTRHIPRKYILCSKNSFPFAPVLAETAAKAKSEGWPCFELQADHTAPETHAKEIADLLMECI